MISGFPDFLEYLKQPELFDPGKNLGYLFAKNFFPANLLDFFSRIVKVHKNKVFPIINRLIYYNAAGNNIHQFMVFSFTPL